ncbi:MAG: hypothetical protein L3J43_05395 [Sulfurovum sp.]|nr:hypothetical protein [Sulfurovum sp.]
MSEQSLDEWQILLVQKKLELEECQNNYQVNSCLKCDKLLDCSTRDDYIKAVYDSMSKGKGGGFEF